MALITCPECKKKISETADNCPNCAYKLASYEKANIKKKEQQVQKGCGIGCLSVIVFFVILYMINSFSLNNTKTNTLKTKKETRKEQKSVAVPYKIQNEKDLSSPIPFPGTRSIETVIKKKILYSIILGDSVNKEQVRATVDKVINDLRRKNPEVDEMILYLCSTAGVASYGTYDIGQAIWAPNGELGNVTAKIAQNDLRDNYSLSLEIKDNLEEYLEKKRNTYETEKFGLTHKKRKEIYIELVRALDKGIKMADMKHSIGTPKHSETTDRLIEEYIRDVVEKYGISKHVADEISMEGFSNKWPQPKF